MEKKHKEDTLKAVQNMPHEMGSTANISKVRFGIGQDYQNGRKLILNEYYEYLLVPDL